MNTRHTVVELAAQAHKEHWSTGGDVSAQTKKSQKTCKEWQRQTLAKFGDRFRAEHPIGREGREQKIDLVDLVDSVAYEFKVSDKNVHMEIYRDVFKVLVFNKRHPALALKTLVFIAPREGLAKLTDPFVRDVQIIATRLGLELELEPI